jgi:hypothetical protein
MAKVLNSAERSAATRSPINAPDRFNAKRYSDLIQTVEDEIDDPPSFFLPWLSTRRRVVDHGGALTGETQSRTLNPSAARGSDDQGDFFPNPRRERWCPGGKIMVNPIQGRAHRRQS